jgi:hypothetical protein
MRSFPKRTHRLLEQLQQLLRRQAVTGLSNPPQALSKIFSLRSSHALRQELIKGRPVASHGWNELPVRMPFPEIAGLRILEVDDQADTVETLRVIFERCGAEVRISTSTAAALGVLELDATVRGCGYWHARQGWVRFDPVYSFPASRQG